MVAISRKNSIAARSAHSLVSTHGSTPRATANLIREGVDSSDISEVGNTVIDSLA